MTARFWRCAAFATLTLLAIADRAQADGEVRLLTYEGYADPAWAKEFTDQTGIAVKTTYVGGVDEEIAKMKAAGGKDYDVVAVDTASLKTFADQKLIDVIDQTQVPNLSNLLPEFKDMSNANIDGKIYGIPFAWGSLGLVYDKKTFPTTPTSWSVLWDPKYKGKIISLDDANNCVNFAAIALGIKQPFQLTDEQFAAVKQKLVDFKHNLLTYYAGFDEGTTIWSENNVVLMFAMGESNAIKLKEKGFDVGYTIPQEGAVGWLDNMTVSSGSPNKANAYKWINFVYQKKIGADLTKKTGWASTTAPAEGLDYASKLVWAKNPEDYNRRQNLWNEVKASQ